MEHKIFLNHIGIGKIGENLACRFLKRKGYRIIERNFKRKWGEIDIVCIKKPPVISSLYSMWSKSATSVLYGTDGKLIFAEVKTLKNNKLLKPEDNLTSGKQKKLIRTCQLYISEKNINPDIEWRIDAILIVLDIPGKKARVRHLKGAVY